MLNSLFKHLNGISYVKVNSYYNLTECICYKEICTGKKSLNIQNFHTNKTMRTCVLCSSMIRNMWKNSVLFDGSFHVIFLFSICYSIFCGDFNNISMDYNTHF